MASRSITCANPLRRFGTRAPNLPSIGQPLPVWKRIQLSPSFGPGSVFGSSQQLQAAGKQAAVTDRVCGVSASRRQPTRGASNSYPADFLSPPQSRRSLVARNSLTPAWDLARNSRFFSATPLKAMAAPAVEASQKRVLLPIADGTEEMEAVIVADVLRRAGADVTVASVEAQLTVNASRGVKLAADKLIGECTGDKFDLIVLPGGMPGSERLRDSATLRRMVEAQTSANAEVAAICAAPVVALQPWGVLKGKRATAHPNFSDKLDDKSAAADRVVVDGTVTTSRGPGTAFEFALSLVEKLYGSVKAAEVAGPMVMAKGDGTDRWRETIGSAPGIVSVTPKVLVPVANGSEEMEAVIVIDVLRRAGVDVVVASVEPSLDIVASRKVKLAADVKIDDIAQDEVFDLIVLPGGMPGAERLRDSSSLDAILRKHAGEGKSYAAICAAPVVALQAKGLLDGRKATAHPAFSDKLPDQSVVPVRVLSDGGVVTSRGPGTAFEFALALVEMLCGVEKAAAVAKPMVVPDSLVPAVAA